MIVKRSGSCSVYLLDMIEAALWKDAGLLHAIAKFFATFLSEDLTGSFVLSRELCFL